MSVDTARRAAATVATGALLAAPTVLAFFSGGYFGAARAWAGAGMWVLVALAAVPAPGGLPRDRLTWLTIAALAGLAAWTLLSILWAPVAGSAYAAGQIAVLYLGALIAATLLLRRPAARPWMEPVLAAGIVIVIGYGLSERLLPGLLHFTRSVTAQGRLEQPLTYWNAMGELAAIGVVLCARLTGSADRPVVVRCAAASAAAPLGMGLYISFSRAALFACVAGLVTVIAAGPRRERLTGAAVAVLSAAIGAAVAAPARGVTALAGSLSARETEGAITLGAVLAVAVAAAVVARLIASRGPRGPLSLPPRPGLIATLIVCAGLATATVLGANETSGSPALSGGANRLVTLQSNRYDYWAVALRAFATSPVDGVGAGGWSVYWLRWRTINEFAQNAHSLEFQTLSDLGLVGIVLLMGTFIGVGLAARRALRWTPAAAGLTPAVGPAAAGPTAALVVYLAHSPLDWDWQMPAVTLVAVVLAGSLLGATAPPRPAADVEPAAANKIDAVSGRR